MENNSLTNASSEEQQSQSEPSGDKPGLSQLRKSWGFRRSTIAQREFIEEVGDVTHSPSPVRRARSRRSTQTPSAFKDNKVAQAPQASLTVMDDLEWSAPSSPGSEETKPALSTVGGCLDPTMWQDIGSAFDTAFSLLGGDEGLSMDMSDDLAIPDILGVSDTTEPPPLLVSDDTEISELRGRPDNDGILQPMPTEKVASGDVDVVLISSQDEESDETTSIQIEEQVQSKSKQGTSAGRGGRGRARGRGRGRGKGKGRGRGRGRGKVVEVESLVACDEDDDVMLVNPSEGQLQHLQREHKDNDLHTPEMDTYLAHSVVTLSPVQQTSSDCIIIDTDVEQNKDTTTGQYDDAPEEADEQYNKDKDVMEHSSIFTAKTYDPSALYCICRQKHNKRFMVSCDSCQECFHGDCVGVSETEGRTEYVCPPCTTKKLSQSQSEVHTQPEPYTLPADLSLIPSGDKPEGQEEQDSLKTVELEENDIEEASAISSEPGRGPGVAMAADSSLPLCIGPGCTRPALQGSVYCGTDCIIQHATFTMQSLSDTKVPKPTGGMQRKASPTTPAAKGQCSRVSARLAAKAEENAKKEELMEGDGTQTEATSTKACDPTLTEVQATSLPSSKLYTALTKECKEIEPETPQKQKPEDPPTDESPPQQPSTEPVLPQSDSHTSKKDSANSDISEEASGESVPFIPPTGAKSGPPPPTQSPNTGTKQHERGVVLNTLTAYIIPKKQSGLQPSSSHMAASCQKPLAPTVVNETRNLPVPPAPSAPSSRPSQPNNQVRQSIQRSLTSILFKRVCDCEDLDMSESDAAKLVASIEMEMFDIFRNTDSKYMNKYRTIMFNLKDPRHKGFLYRVVQGDISPFRLVRMSQKDMQATKAPDQNVKDTSEVKNAAAKVPGLSQKPEVVKVDLSCLNITKPERRSVGNKRSMPTPTLTLKNRGSEPRKESAVPDVLTCMLKDTTSEHKAHLFDLKCKICTGQIPALGEEEPPNKKNRISEPSDKHYSQGKQGDDSPLWAPPDSPDMDYSTLCPYDPPSRLIIDTGDLTIVESPASPVMDSPASPTFESPASPVMESPTSPSNDTSKTTASKRAYTPVVIPAISTVTITRRDPRTAANRSSASSRGPTNASHNQSAPYGPRGGSTASSSVPTLSVRPAKLIPKPILMKPSSSADPRLYGTSSRTVISESLADGATAQFLAKQETLWKGFLNMLTVTKFATKGYLVSGSAEILKSELPDTIEIGGRIMPQTVWDYVAKLKTSITKELCVIRFHPATEEEEVAYVSLFSYFSSRGRFGVVSNNSRSIKDIYLLPLSAKESIPSILQPLEGPGIEKDRPNLILGLAVIQKPKRPGSVLQEIEEKKPKVHMSKDPMWIPKPPVLYGSDKLEMFQPYDPHTPVSTTPLIAPPCPGSPSDSSSSSDTMPSLLASIKSNPAVSTSAPATSTQSTFNNEKNPKSPSNDTPLKTILSTLFRNKQTGVMVSNDESFPTNSTTVSAKKSSVLSHVSGSMVDPIVQQYGQKSKVKEIEEEENAFDRPYDPEEEYDPAIGYGTLSSQSTGKKKPEDPPLSAFDDEDDVAYDPEDETIFQDLPSDAKKLPDQPQMNCPLSFPNSTQVATPAFTTIPTQTSVAEVPQTSPTGTVVVSAATLTEQQRMLEELNKQIEEQKRQLKEQEEALRQQREAVGMFMAHFSVTDSMISAPSKPLSQVSSLQSGRIHSGSKPSEQKDSKIEQASNLTDAVDEPHVDSQTDKQENANGSPCLNITSVAVQDAVSDNIKENEKYSSAGEIEDSDVPYDPEDDIFNEIQDDVFQGSTSKIQDSSLLRTGHGGISPNSYHSRRRRSSPKRRSHRERDSHRNPSRRAQRRSTSHSRKHRERDRYRKSERDRSKHRTKGHSERQARHDRVHSTRRHSRGRRRSPTSPSKRDGGSQGYEFKALSPHDSDGHNLISDIGVTIPLQKSSDKDFKQENVPSVNPETSQQPNSQELLQNTVSVHDNSGIVPLTQTNEHIQQETSGNKLESSIPLRELDPPIRDSPESPDPDPRFIPPSSIENNPPAKSEEIIDSEDQISDPAEKVQNDCQLYGSQETLLNMPPPTEGIKSNVGIDLRAKDIQGLNPREQGMTGKCFGQKHSEIQKIAKGVITNVPETGNDLKCSDGGPEHYTKHPNIKTEENMSEFPCGKLGVMDIGKSQIQSKLSNLTGKGIDHNNQSQNFPQVRDFQSLSRSDDLNRGHCDQESSAKSNLSTGSNDTYLTPSFAVSDDKRHIKRDQDASTANIKYEHYDTSYIGQDSIESAHLQEAQFDVKFERSVHGLDMKESDKQLELRRRNRREACSLGPGEGVACLGGQDLSDVVNSIAVTSGRGIGETFPDGCHASIQGISKQNQCQQDPCTASNIKNADCRGPQPGIWVHRVQNTELVECNRDLDWGCPGLVRDYDTDINSTGSASVRVGQLAQDEEQVHEPSHGWIGASMESHGPDRRVAGDVHPCKSWTVGGLNVGATKHDSRGPGDPDAMGPWGEEIQVHDRRGPGSPHFMKTEPQSQGPTLEGLRNDRRGKIVPDFMGPGTRGRGPDMNNWHGPGDERVCTDMRVPVHTRKGPDACDFRTQEIGNATMTGPVSSRQSIGPDFRGPRPEKRHAAINSLGHGVRGPLVPENLGPCFERGPGTEGPVHDGGQAEGGPHYRGPVTDWKDSPMQGTDHDMRGPVGPDCREPWNERRGPERVMQHCNRKGTEGHDAREQGPVVRRCAMESPRIAPKGGSHFNEPGNGRLNLPINSPKFDREGQRGPDLRGMEPERRELGVPKCFGPGHRGHNVRGPRFEMRCIEGQGPPNLRRGDQNTDELGTRPYASGPGHDLMENRFEKLGPHNRRAWSPRSESMNPNMEQTEPHWRGPDIRGPIHEKNLPRPDNRGHVPFMEQRMVQPRVANMNRPVYQHLGPNTELPGSSRIHPEREETRFGSKGPRPFGGPGPNQSLPEMDPESNCRGSYFGAGLEPERKGPSSRDFRGPICERKNPNINSLGLERREPGDPDSRKNNFERSPDGPGPNWRSDGLQYRGPGIRQNSIRSGPDNREDQRHENKCNLSVTVFRGPEPDQNCHGGRWKAVDYGYSDSETQFEDEWKHPDNRYPHPITEDIDVPVDHGNVQRGPGIRGFELMPEMKNLPFSGPRRVPGDDWSDPGPFQGDADRVCPRPSRGGPGNGCRKPGRGRSGQRWRSDHMDFREQGHERRGPMMGAPVSDKRGDHEAVRLSGRGPNLEEPRPIQGGPDLKNSFKNRREFEMHDNRDTDVRFHGPENPNLERPFRDFRNSEPRAMEPERNALDIEISENPNRQGFEHRFRTQGPDINFRHRENDMRGEPGNLRLGRGPVAWVADTQVSVCNRRDEDTMDPGLDSRQPSHAMRDGMQCSDIRASRRYNRRSFDMRGRRSRQRGRALRGSQCGIQGSEEKSFGISANPQSEEVKAPKPRAALLPTPTEGRVCLPNHRINSSMKQKHIGHHINK
ncbi:uncharacterized protein si:ch73-181d5.4 isoform X2 [Dunckerocampus dactyliophorus]|uniref:uncharacterized protein si:ch73-181d5.4 isoform X2 n=1 Tax=Dunckerocampus dactyliophorus TaxID=161453 RepID=UPI0024055EF4|nr:uncharacterized protein si:ch73-181d5.4 isoform X2 [Dunckerocampus dactyliophorus]